MNNSKQSLDSRIDYTLIFPVFILMLVGLFSLFVAINHDQSSSVSSKTLLFQALWYALGAVAVIICMQFKARWLWRLTPLFYAVNLVIMGLLVKFYDRNLALQTGSHNWFRIGQFSFQPSELMKIAFILMLAFVVKAHNDRNLKRTLQTDFLLILKMAICFLPIVVLLMLQKDFGTLLVFVAILGGVFILSGIQWKIIIPVVLFAAILSVTVIYLVTTDFGRDLLTKIGFKSYQFTRIDSWLDPFKDASNSSFQQAQALMAIGSGGLFGKGFNVSEVYVPVRESDMIFTVPAENFGFVGSCLIILMYFILIYRMIKICFETNNEFYAYIATGIIMMLLFHIFENIGANIGLLPLTGIPLPFISQGGSSILANMLGVGLMMSMTFHKYDNEFE